MGIQGWQRPAEDWGPTIQPMIDPRLLTLVGSTYVDLEPDEVREMLTKLPWDRLTDLAYKVRDHEILLAMVTDEMRERDEGTRRDIDRLMEEVDEIAGQLHSVARLAAMARNSAPLDT